MQIVLSLFLFGRTYIKHSPSPHSWNDHQREDTYQHVDEYNFQLSFSRYFSSLIYQLKLMMSKEEETSNNKSPERKNLLEDPEFIALHNKLLKQEEKLFNEFWPRFQNYLDNLNQDKKEQKVKALQLVRELHGIAVEGMGKGIADSLANKIASIYLNFDPKITFIPSIFSDDATILPQLCPEFF